MRIWAETLSNSIERSEHRRKERGNSVSTQAGRDGGQKAQGGQSGRLAGICPVVSQSSDPSNQAIEREELRAALLLELVIYSICIAQLSDCKLISRRRAFVICGVERYYLFLFICSILSVSDLSLPQFFEDSCPREHVSSILDER